MSDEPVLYKRRWAFLFCLFVLQFFLGNSFSSFGQISSFYVQYFHTTHAIVDWITNARNVSGVLLTLPAAVLVHKGKLNLRLLVLLDAALTTLGLLLVTLSLLSDSYLEMVITGQFIAGVASFFGVAVPATFAALWFPEKQVGTAIAANFIGMYCGDGTGYFLPPLLLYSTNGTWNETTNLSPTVMARGERLLQIMYGSLLAIAAAVTLFLAVFFTSKPPTPPTFAQAQREAGNVDHATSGGFWSEVKALLTNYSFMFISIAIGLNFGALLSENMMMSEIIANVHFEMPNTKPVLVSGFVMSTFSMGALIGSILTGKVVDLCKRYKLLAIVSNALVLVSLAGVTLGTAYEQVSVVFTFNACFGCFSAMCVVVSFEMVNQFTFPTKEAFANVWTTGLLTTVAALVPIAERGVLDAFGRLGAQVFLCVCVLAGLVLTLFVSSRYRRLEAGIEVEQNSDNERRPLLGQ